MAPPLVVLAGGLGTRLRSVTGGGAKALATVRGSEEMLHHVLAHWSARGATEAVLCLGYRADDVEAALARWADLTISVTVRREERVLGTGGAVAAALPLLPSEFFVVNGDTILDLHLGAVARWHRCGGWDATLVMSPPREPRGDRMAVATDGSIRSMRWTGKEPLSTWVFGGVALLTRRLFEPPPAADPSSLEADVLAGALQRGLRLGALRTRRPFYDLGTPERLREYEDRLSHGRLHT